MSSPYSKSYHDFFNVNNPDMRRVVIIKDAEYGSQYWDFGIFFYMTIEPLREDFCSTCALYGLRYLKRLELYTHIKGDVIDFTRNCQIVYINDELMITSKKDDLEFRMRQIIFDEDVKCLDIQFIPASCTFNTYLYN